MPRAFTTRTLASTRMVPSAITTASSAATRIQVDRQNVFTACPYRTTERYPANPSKKRAQDCQDAAIGAAALHLARLPLSSRGAAGNSSVETTVVPAARAVQVIRARSMMAWVLSCVFSERAFGPPLAVVSSL